MTLLHQPSDRHGLSVETARNEGLGVVQLEQDAPDRHQHLEPDNALPAFVCAERDPHQVGADKFAAIDRFDEIFLRSERIDVIHRRYPRSCCQSGMLPPCQAGGQVNTILQDNCGENRASGVDSFGSRESQRVVRLVRSGGE